MVNKNWNEKELLMYIKDVNCHIRLPCGWLDTTTDEKFAVKMQGVAIVPKDLTLDEYHAMFDK